MNKFKFYKNNIRQEIPISDKLIFLKKDLIIIKENNETKLVLNFNKKECLFTLKKEGLTVNIPILEMDYVMNKNTYYMNYKLVSEPEVKNLIKIVEIETKF